MRPLHSRGYLFTRALVRGVLFTVALLGVLWLAGALGNLLVELFPY